MIFLKKEKTINRNTRKGFAMLFAVLTSSILITIGVSIFNISLKEIMIATAAKDSQIAYYSADSAQECALYWDLKIGSFPTCLDDSCSSVSTSTTNTIICNGGPVTLNFQKSGNTHSYSTTTFFRYGSSLIEPDSSLLVTKEYITDGGSGVIQTVIQTRGHNTGVIGRRVERGISQSYNQ